MGLFDTFILEPAVVCAQCGKTHDHVQSHHFGDCMATWRIGNVLQYCPVHTGIIKDDILCCKIPDSESGYYRIEVWIVIWHGIYAGYALDEHAALQRLNGVDRLDLISWIDKAQSESQTWRRRYRSLTRDLRDLIEWNGLTDEERSAKDSIKRKVFIQLPDEIRDAPDPLSRILERNAEDQPPSGMWFDS